MSEEQEDNKTLRDRIEKKYDKRRRRTEKYQLADRLGKALADIGAGVAIVKAGVPVNKLETGYQADWAGRLGDLDKAEAGELDPLDELKKSRQAMKDKKELAEYKSRLKKGGKDGDKTPSYKIAKGLVTDDGQAVQIVSVPGEPSYYMDEDGKKRSRRELREPENALERERIDLSKKRLKLDREKTDTHKKEAERRQIGMKDTGLVLAANPDLEIRREAGTGDFYVYGRLIATKEQGLDRGLAISAKGFTKVEKPNEVLYVDNNTNEVIKKVDLTGKSKNEKYKFPTDISSKELRTSVNKRINDVTKEQTKFLRENEKLMNMEDLTESDIPGVRGILTTINAKTIGSESGALAEGDVKRADLIADLRTKIKQTIEDLRTGKMTPELKRRFREVREIANKNKGLIEDMYITAQAGKLVNSLGGTSNIDIDTARKWLKGEIVEGQESREAQGEADPDVLRFKELTEKLSNDNISDEEFTEWESLEKKLKGNE